MVPIDSIIKNDLFRYEKEFTDLSLAIQHKDPLIVIVGPTGTGKTYLVRELLEKYTGVYVDLTEYRDKKNFRRSYFVEQIEKNIQKIIETSPTLQHHLQRIKGVEISKNHIYLDNQLKKLDLVNLFDALDKWGKDDDKQFVLAIYDVSLLSKFQHLNFDNLFAYIIDNCSNISIILLAIDEETVRNVCKFDNPKEPLFGRVYTLIKLEINKAWIVGTVKNALQSHDAYNNIKNIVKRINLEADVNHPIITLAINELLNTHLLDKKTSNLLSQKYSKLAENDFDSFLTNRIAKEKYQKIIKILSKQPLPWKRIKELLELDVGEKLYDKNFNDLLNALEINNFIEKDSGLYKVKNPLLSLHYSLLDNPVFNNTSVATKH